MLRIKISIFAPILAAIFCVIVLNSTAQAVPTPAVTFSNLVSTTPTNSDETVGWTFTVNAPIDVTALGVFDSGENGLATSHAVGIWNSAGVLIASATVASGTTDPLTNQFRYVGITPVILGSGTYTIGALWSGQPSADDYIADASSFSTIPDITFLSAWFAVNSPGSHAY